VRHKNIYGIDIPSDKNLIANGRDVPEIASLLGCEQIFYQDLDLMCLELKKMNPLIDGFECSLFTGSHS
jgi:amidophosphoribosyltransferase